MVDRYQVVHQSPKGPGDSRPTALQIVQDEKVVGKLSEKVILITGTSGGIGLEMARALYETGATLYLTARDLNKTKAGLGDAIVNSERVHLLELDQSSLANVRAFVNDFKTKTPTLNILIANAGVMFHPESRTVDGFETHFAVNHLSHFLLINLLLPQLLAATTPVFKSRVIILSSLAHRMSSVHFDNINLQGEYDEWKAYGQSKTMNVWAANELDRRYGFRGLHAWSVHPGGIATTDLGRHMPEEVLKQVLSIYAQDKGGSRFKSNEQGAATAVWAAVATCLEGQGGRYLEDCQISKPYDPETGRRAPGHASHAYDEEKEKMLWDASLKWVGLS